MQHAPHRPGSAALVAAALAALVLAGCASDPRSKAPGTATAPPRPVQPPPGRDGPEANPPPDLDKVPDAEPRLEAVRPGGPNKPYELMGKQYVPLPGDPPFRESGLASWYGRKFHGRPTASGELYNMYAMTAAHPTLPIPSYVRVRNPANGREVIVRVNDRGPFHSERIIDLSYTAALKLDLLRGVRVVEIERITYEDIRTGAWRRDGPATTMLAQVQPPRADDTPAARPPAADKPVVQASPVPAAADPIPQRGRAAGDVPPLPAVATGPVAETAGAVAGTPAVADGTSSPSTTAPVSVGQPPSNATPDTARAFTTDARGFWLQLGAFKQSAGAMDFQRRVEREVDWLGPLLAIFNDRSVHRLQAGPYRTRSEASTAAERIRQALQLVPVIVERK